MRLTRHTYSRERKRLKKALAKAIRQHKARKYIREELITLNNYWFYQTGGILQVFRKKYLRLSRQAFNVENPMLRLLEKARNKEENKD